jgi:hypothetical protein
LGFIDFKGIASGNLTLCVNWNLWPMASSMLELGKIVTFREFSIAIVELPNGKMWI